MDQVAHSQTKLNQTDKPHENPFLSVVEGYYSGVILDGLHRAGLLALLKNPLTAEELAVESGTDARLLTPILAYLSSQGQWLIYEPASETYRVHPSYFDSPMAKHLIDQYIGAYGPCLAELHTLLHKPSQGSRYVDRTRHATAFAKASGAPNDLVELILRLTPGTVLDLGCGSAGLLHRLVEADREISGIGIDMNTAMLDLARNSAAKGTEDRLQFQTGDILSIAKALSADIRDSVDVIVAQSIANEYFAERTIDSFLACLSSAFPDRLLILADYYGCLGDGGPMALPDQRRGVLHDIAQVLSGQGIPPRALEDWQEIYTRNSCTLLKASSVVSGGLHRFIHIVKV